MKLLNKNETNFITEHGHQGHIIEKYEFRSINKELSEEITPALQENGFYTPSNAELKEGEIDQKKFEELLEGYKKLELKLDGVTKKLEEQENQEGFVKILEESKKEAYTQGLLEGEKKAKDELFAEINKQKQSMVVSLENLEKALLDTQNQIQKIQEDLSVIALDLAKEVILKEVQEGSKEIALQIAKELLKPIAEAQKVVIKANPLDIGYLQEQLCGLKNIAFESDLLIVRGGVIVISDKGSYDGSILSRYKNLKRSILEDKGL